MKLCGKQMESDGSGRVSVIPELADDLWHLYNLLAKRDRVRAVTLRKVAKQSAGTGSVKTEVKKLVLTLAVTNVDYDADANLLRVSGTNVSESPHIKMGQYHTLQIELHDTVTVSKGNWDSLYMKRLEESLDMKKRAEIAVVLIDAGIANLYVLTSSLVKTVLKIQVNIPKNRGPRNSHNAAIERFFQQVLEGMIRHFDMDGLQCILIAGPGFVREDFYEWMLKEARSKGTSTILANESKFVMTRASTAFKQGLNELLSDPTVKAKMSNSKASSESAVLDEFYSTLQREPDSACYGPRHVAEAVKLGAVKTLLVTDGLFRSSNVGTRKRYVAMTEEVKGIGGSVMIFSDLHVSGEQLSRISGIAAILRYPVPELNEIDNEFDPSTHKEEEEAAITEQDV